MVTGTIKSAVNAAEKTIHTAEEITSAVEGGSASSEADKLAKEMALTAKQALDKTLQAAVSAEKILKQSKSWGNTQDWGTNKNITEERLW